MNLAAGPMRAGKPDTGILAVTLVLVVIGLIFVWSSSLAIGLAEHGNANHFLERQAMWAVIGLGAMLVLMRLDYHRLRVLSAPLMIGAVVALGVVLLIGEEEFGARSRISIGLLPAVQPSEFAKLAIIIYIAAWLTSRGRNLKDFLVGFVPFVFVVGAVAALVLLQPDTGTAAVIIVTTFTLFFLAGASLTHVATLAASGGVTAALLLLSGGYRQDRLLAFLDPDQDPRGIGFQINQLLIALGSGGVDGLGLGVSRQKFFYVPGAHTDGVFAIIGEETGFIGAMMVIALFAYFIYRGFRVFLSARDDFGAYLAAGVVCWIAFQALMNVGGITKSIPLTGIPLPFVSYGGASLAMTMAAAGVLLSVSRFRKEAEAPVRRQARRAGARAPA
jgi:cell division protein FtsW